MRSRLLLPLVVLAALAVAAPATAHRRHVSVGVRLGWAAGWYAPGWWYGPGAYAPAGYAGVPADVGIVDTDISPEHARVFLDGTQIGTADDFDGYPSYLFLKPGRYTIEFRLQGYAPESLTLEVAEGRFFPLDIKLARVPSEAPAPWYDRPRDAPASRVYGPARPVTPAAESGPDVTLRPDLERSLARGAGERPAAAAASALDISVTPPQASVYLDGEFVGTGGELARLERGLAVTPGTHRLEAMGPGLEPRSVSVDVQEGERRQVVVALEARAGQM